MALNALNELAKSLSPPPPYTKPEYDGLEYRWNTFVFRPALFKTEAFLLAGVVVYVVLYFVGKSFNRRRAEAWFDAHYPLLSQQFSKPSSSSGLLADGNADFFSFSTGRRYVASLHTVFSLLPRHDVGKRLYQLAWELIDLVNTKEDEVELDFKLFPSATPNFVWGVVTKDYLAKVKQGRWDLTFTRTTESPLLGGGYCVMSEYADVTEAILKSSGPLNIAQALNDPAVKPYVKSLTITDQPRERPYVPIPADQRERHLILSLRLPSSAHAGATLPLVRAVLAFIDALEAPGSKFSLRPETRTKLRKTRDELDETLRREAEAEKREEVELEKAAEKKRIEADRVNKLSAAEQKKELERDRKRQLRKAQGKTAVKK